MGVDFGISFPQAYEPGPGWLDQLATFLTRAEAGGISSVWMQEQLAGTDPSFEPLVALAYAAAATSTMTLGTATVVASLRQPLLLAKQVATLDQLSNGRVVLTVSVGGDDPRIFDAAGIAVRQRLPRMVDALGAATALWTEPSANFQGPFSRLESVSMEPKPVQRPHPPIWFGGDVDAALHRAVALGSGWMGAGGSSTAAFAARVKVIDSALGRLGRDRSSFAVAKKLYLCIDEDANRARADLEHWFQGHWPPHMEPLEKCRQVGAWGTVDDVAEQVNEVIEAGADLVVLNPVSREFDQLDALIEITGRFRDRHRKIKEPSDA